MPPTEILKAALAGFPEIVGQLLEANCSLRHQITNALRKKIHSAQKITYTPQDITPKPRKIILMPGKTPKHTILTLQRRTLALRKMASILMIRGMMARMNIFQYYYF